MRLARPAALELHEMEVGHGFTRVIGPNGCVVAQLPSDEEGICYAEADLEEL